jgi:hexosaminidase
MSRGIAVLFMFMALALATAVAQAPATSATTHTLMPVPKSVTFQAGRLPIQAGLTVAISKHSDSRLLAGLDRALRRLERRTGLEFPRGLAQDASAATLAVQVDGPGSRVPSLDENESYSLTIDGKQALLKAPTSVGALRGFETLLQLLAGDRHGYYLPAVTINDEPRFPWRGLMIDVGRHFLPIEVIKRNLDGMAAMKLNVLHLHLTEDQGFRIESKKFPKLHQQGSDGLFFTQDQIREIIAYAAERGIRVVPEFDMPGHVTAWLVGHPELGSAPGPYEIGRKWGVMDAALDPTREGTYKFLDVFLGEMAALFPDAYLHIGGDENEGKHWNANPAIKAFMAKNSLADAHALQAYFNRRLLKILTKHGKRMMGWDEIFHPDLPKDIVVQSWRGPQSLAEGARKGYTGILSNGYYIDLMEPTSRHYLVDPLPASSGLSPEEAARIIGGEATMWSEWVTPETVDSRIWPRTAAIAERFWSPGSVRDVPDMYRRLVTISLQLGDLGLQHESLAPMMLRRMTGTHAIGPIGTLAAVVEPVKGYRRGRERPGGQLSPLTGLVDVARADSMAALKFRMAVDEMLSDAPRFRDRREEIVTTLQTWRDIRPAIDRLIDGAPILREAEPLAVDLAAMGTMGIEAVSYLATGTAPPTGWPEAALAQLDAAAKPRAALELAVVLPMRKLVVACAEMGQLSAMSRDAWKTRVDTLAVPPPPQKK